MTGGGGSSWKSSAALTAIYEIGVDGGGVTAACLTTGCSGSVDLECLFSPSSSPSPSPSPSVGGLSPTGTPTTSNTNTGTNAPSTLPGSATPTAPPCAAPPGSFCSGGSVLPCPGGSFANTFGATSCEVCPGGHYCPAGTSSWARLNCGRGNYCPDGSAVPIPCPILIVPVPYASWAVHPLTAQGPAFLVETAHCLNHCFWNFTSGDGMLSKC